MNLRLELNLNIQVQVQSQAKLLIPTTIIFLLLLTTTKDPANSLARTASRPVQGIPGCVLHELARLVYAANARKPAERTAVLLLLWLALAADATLSGLWFHFAACDGFGF
jgi:hypothetical protein